MDKQTCCKTTLLQSKNHKRLSSHLKRQRIHSKELTRAKHKKTKRIEGEFESRCGCLAVAGVFIIFTTSAILASCGIY